MAKHEHGMVTSYDSFEEMLEDQQRAHDAAMENMTASQRAIPLGGYACNLTHLADLGPIFGVIQSVAEVRAWHELYYGVGGPEARAVLARRGYFKLPHHAYDPADKAWRAEGYASAEDAIQAAVEQHEQSWRNGYLFGMWMSNMEPDGELGSAHASVCVQITKEAFDDALTHGGYVHPDTATQISQAMQVIRQELLAREQAQAQAEDLEREADSTWDREEEGGSDDDQRGGTDEDG